MTLLTVDESSWFVGVTPLAMTFGVLLSIPICELVGRKKMFLASNFCAIVGLCCHVFWHILLGSSSWQTGSVHWYGVGRHDTWCLSV